MIEKLGNMVVDGKIKLKTDVARTPRVFINGLLIKYAVCFASPDF